ncbi:hypothetical protein HNY73_021087 [Argiope bruennichi]|uniref:Uncharacterized protein n=1 Tax=Argiope bruennichi TaxID=94029 RepID=A0A8T0EA38_ARGBR|nr:hypothetical protein HNY73_021087 [Argiope bruennichi]
MSRIPRSALAHILCERTFCFGIGGDAPVQWLHVVTRALAFYFGLPDMLSVAHNPLDIGPTRPRPRPILQNQSTFHSSELRLRLFIASTQATHRGISQPTGTYSHQLGIVWSIHTPFSSRLAQLTIYTPCRHPGPHYLQASPLHPEAFPSDPNSEDPPPRGCSRRPTHTKTQTKKMTPRKTTAERSTNHLD